MLQCTSQTYNTYFKYPKLFLNLVMPGKHFVYFKNIIDGVMYSINITQPSLLSNIINLVLDFLFLNFKHVTTHPTNSLRDIILDLCMV